MLRSQAEVEGGLRRIAKAAACELMGLGNEVTPSLLAEGASAREGSSLWRQLPEESAFPDLGGCAF